jgi:tetratricopeptide (TPR) repeat protein
VNVDEVWKGTESELPAVIRDLEESAFSGTMSLRLWLSVLVPFVASLFARGVDFEAQFDERMRQLVSGATYDALYPDGELRRANTNQARLIEVVRLLAPIMKASCRVLHNATTTPLILNDRGFALYHLSPTEPFYGLPLTPRLMLLLRTGLPVPSRDFEGGRVSGIAHLQMSPQDVASANEGTFRFAVAEVYGPTSRSLESLGEWPPAEVVNFLRLIGSHALMPRGFDLRFHESDWLEAAGKFMAKQNYLPKLPGLPALIRIDLPMLPAQEYFLGQLTLNLAESSLHEGRATTCLEHCAVAAERNPEAVSDWVRQRLKITGFGRRRGKTVQQVADQSKNTLGSPHATAYEACAAAIRLALIEAGQSRYVEARALFERAALSSRGYEATKIRCAMLMRAYGDHEGAVDNLRDVTKKTGSHFSEAASRLGDLLLDANPIEAEAWLQAAVNSGPGEWAARAMLRVANLLRERGDRLHALEGYRRAESTGHPDVTPAAAYNHAVYLMEIGHPHDALKLWRRGFGGRNPFWKAHCAMALGQYFFSHDRFKEARPFLHFAAASRLPQIKDGAALNFGLVLLAAAELESAEYWLEQVAAEASSDLATKARTALAAIEERRGNPADAIRYLSEVAGGDSADLAADALVRWGRLLETQGDSAEAARIYKRALDVGQPGHSEAAALHLAMLARDEGDLTKALALATAAAASQEDGVAGRAANLAAICSNELGEHDDAKRWFERASRSRDQRQSAIGQANLGGTLLDEGRATEGLEILRKAKSRGGPGAVFASMNLADHWLKEGQHSQAEREYRRAMSTEGGRYRTQAALPYANFLSSAGRIQYARQLIHRVISSAGPRQRLSLEGAARHLDDAAEGAGFELHIDSPTYVEDEDEKPHAAKTQSVRRASHTIRSRGRRKWRHR